MIPGLAALRAVLPGMGELVPWTDKRGRPDWTRAALFAALSAPAAWLAVRFAMGWLGPEPVNAAIHGSGYAAIWILLASLLVTPLRALSARPYVAVLRRMVGNAALLYALLHLVLYMTDQKWRLGTVVSEIVQRFYLTIGFVALTGLLVLGLTSTDGWAAALGRGWKRLHRIVYGIAVLGLVHYVLQSKLDVSQALLAGGVFAWLMLWRLLPAGRDRTALPLACIALGAALLTLVFEYCWYRFGTRIDPMKVVRAELDVAFGLRPAGQVLALGLLAVLLRELRRLGDTPFGASPAFTVLVFGLGSFSDDTLALIMGWSMTDVVPEGASVANMDLLWCVLLGVLGMARWKLRRTWLRHLVDAVWLVCILNNVMLVGTGSRTLGGATSAVIVGFTILLGQRLWAISRGATMTLVPLGLLLAFEAFSLL